MIEIPQATVSTKAALSAGSWTEVADLWCARLVRGLAPTVDQAELVWEFGTLDGVRVEPLNLIGSFVRIECDDPALDWVGYVVEGGVERWQQESDGEDPPAQRLAGGIETFTAVGLEWFLGRKLVVSDRVKTPGGTAVVDRAIGFNNGEGDSRGPGEIGVPGNKSTAAAAFELGKANRTTWKLWGAIEYLLDEHAPQDSAGNHEPCEFVLTAPASLQTYLEAQNTPPTPTEGRSVLELLNALLDQRLGLTWRIEWADLSGWAVVAVDTLAASAVALPGSLTLPACSVQSTFAPDAFDELTQCRYRVNIERQVDRVVVRGARRRSVFTVGVAAGTLEPAWSSAQETAYIDGFSGDGSYGSLTDEEKKRANDRIREGADLERVYQAFRIPSTWNGQSNDGGAGTPGYACPEMAFGSTSSLGPGKLSLPGLRLLPSTPLVVGWDYTNATAPTDADGTATNREFQRPFAVIDAGDASTQWRFVDAINSTTEDAGSGSTVQRKVSYHLRTLAGEPAIQLSPGSGQAHALAKTHFDAGSPALSNQATEVNYDTLRATVCAEWDEYCQGQSPLADPTTDPLDTLYIYIGERARQDYLAPGTIFDCSNGALKTVTTGGLLRDDRNLCGQIARMAYEWYSTARGTLDVGFRGIIEPLAPGTLVTAIGTAEAAETLNAVVSQVIYDWQSGTTTLAAGYQELDFARIG